MTTYLKPEAIHGYTEAQQGQFLAKGAGGIVFIDGGTGTVESVRVQGADGLTSSQSTAQTVSLNTTIGIDSNHKLPTVTEWDDVNDNEYHIVRMVKITDHSFTPNSYMIDDGQDICQVTVNVEPLDNKKYYYIVDIDDVIQATDAEIIVAFNQTGSGVNNKQTNYILFINRTDKEIGIYVERPIVEGYNIDCAGPYSMPIIDPVYESGLSAKEISIIADFSDENPSLCHISWTSSGQLIFMPGY